MMQPQQPATCYLHSPSSALPLLASLTIVAEGFVDLTDYAALACIAYLLIIRSETIPCRESRCQVDGKQYASSSTKRMLADMPCLVSALNSMRSLLVGSSLWLSAFPAVAAIAWLTTGVLCSMTVPGEVCVSA